MNMNRPFKHKVRILHEHTGWSDGSPCATREERGTAPLLFLNTYGKEGLQHVGRDAVGTLRSNWTRWVDIKCNTPGCKFDAMVRIDWIEDMISEGIREGGDG